MDKTKNENCNNTRHPHLSSADRVILGEMLKDNKSLRSISRRLNKSPSTIIREIKKHSIAMPSHRNDCIYIRDCNNTNLCDKSNCRNHKCKSCRILCKKLCNEYVKGYCDTLQKSPYVCNGCLNYTCSYDKKYYKAELAEQDYRSTLINSRNGFNLTNEQFETINHLVSPLIKQGLSPYHIKQTLGDELTISEPTLRRMINNNDLDARNIDLREKVKRKPRRKNHSREAQFPTYSKIGHLYIDYIKYIEENAVCVPQMDCVEGKKEDKAVLLTLHFPRYHMQLAFILDALTSTCVVHELDIIEQTLGKDLFHQMFPAILTDNGHEFADIPGMERSIFDGIRTKIFFCEPNRSDEKGACENNHKMIRDVIPKGTSLEPFQQIQITLMMNHINSYFRKDLGGKSPYQVAMQVLPEDFFILLGLEQIPPKQIILSPTLFSAKDTVSSE